MDEILFYVNVIIYNWRCWCWKLVLVNLFYFIIDVVIISMKTGYDYN